MDCFNGVCVHMSCLYDDGGIACEYLSNSALVTRRASPEPGKWGSGGGNSTSVTELEEPVLSVHQKQSRAFVQNNP